MQLARLVCPIGVPGLESKDPAVIATSTAAQLLIAGGKPAAEERAATGAAALVSRP
jgi:xanthine/CO dehydrogenase XdhC/CoxF family maturation factor